MTLEDKLKEKDKQLVEQAARLAYSTECIERLNAQLRDELTEREQMILQLANADTAAQARAGPSLPMLALEVDEHCCNCVAALNAIRCLTFCRVSLC